MAVMNLSAGVVIASWPERHTDLDTMQRWGKTWLLSASNVYVSDWNPPDYPPHAIVALSPLGVLSPGLAVPLWAGVSVALAILATYLAIRVARPIITLSEAALPMLMFLCWGGFRTLLQFSLLTLTLGLLAMILADRRPGWSGVSLGLALMKPQMAAPFFLWALFTRRLRVAGIAITVVVAGFALFCLRVGASPVAVAIRYGEVLRTLYSGDAIMVGLSQLRPIIARVISNVAIVDAIAGAVAVLMLAGICWLGFAEAKNTKTPMYSAPALVGVWSLLTFYHLTYGFLLLLPAAALLIFSNDSATAAFRTRLFGAMQVGLMVDVPGAWRRLGLVDHVIVGAVLLNFDRIFMLVIFTCLVVLAVKTRRTSTALAARPLIDGRPEERAAEV